MNRSMGMIAGFAMGLLCMLFVGGKRSVPANPPAGHAAQSARPTAAGNNCEIPRELIEPHYLSPVRHAAEQKLRTPISCDFRETPLQDALQHFEKQSGVQFILRDDWLQEDGSDVTRLTPVTFSCDSMPLKRVLRKILFPLRLTHFLDDGEIAVRIAVRVGEKLDTKLYPIGDLAARRAATRLESAMDELIDLITSTLEPETWDGVGGPASIIYEPETMCLLIRQTDAVHDEIEETLVTLRKLRCQLPALLSAAGAPTVDEIRRVEVSFTRLRIELAKMDADLRELEGIDPLKPPFRSAGSGFFQIHGASEKPPRLPADAEHAWRSIAGTARDLARRALTLALHYEQMIDDARKQAADRN